MAERRHKKRFGDTATPVSEDSKSFPGLEGDEKTRKRLTTRLCTSVLQGRKTDIPGGRTKRQAREWCAMNMKGKPFPSHPSTVLKKLCEGLSRANCRKAVLEQEPKTAAGVRVPLTSVVSKGPALVLSTVGGRKLIPGVADAAAPCKEATKGSGLRPCHYELRFFNAEAAEEKGLPGPGPYMRICGKEPGKPGVLYPVATPEEAQALLKQHCDCKKGGKDAETCQKQLKTPAGFGGAVKNPFGLHGYGVRKGK